ncbi:DUF4249 family protein [Membranihabitans maritimus]|uniref:DUF4249 family protein n=1 Tax=Membranihabitans maritimus TaxID=2904244 RepID=UPI001F3D7E16|nr:DUF4249 family protein [Membranihabitans maritimus]
MLIVIFLTYSCEMSRKVPLDAPIYQPQLVIQGLVSPLSGARAIIRYNQPLGDNDVDVPQLPKMEVYLIENGERVAMFEQDSADQFSIPAENLDLSAGMDYAMEVVDLTHERKYVSSDSRLPDPVEVQTIYATQDSHFMDDYALGISLGEVEQKVEAVSVYPVLLDSMMQPVKQISNWQTQEVNFWNKISTRVEYTNDGLWTKEKELLFRLSRDYLNEGGEPMLADHVDVYITYLPTDLTRFVRDLEELYFSGEDIFQQVRPVYSNFDNAQGVFGVFSETKRRLEIRR